jgi:hypothetical protein
VDVDARVLGIAPSAVGAVTVSAGSGAADVDGCSCLDELLAPPCITATIFLVRMPGILRASPTERMSFNVHLALQLGQLSFDIRDCEMQCIWKVCLHLVMISPSASFPSDSIQMVQSEPLLESDIFVISEHSTS